ncbi:hypothetical protein GCM10027447_31890 [Glycomyces halotolerans]
MSDLIAENSGPGATTGARFVDSLNAVRTDMGVATDQEFNGTALAIDGVVAGLDILALAANPFKEFIMAGLGWIIEHVDWLREPLDALAGDPGEITALSQTWSNISGELLNAADALATEVAGTAGWEGDAADAYREVNAAFSGAVSGAAGAAQTTSNWIAGVGIVVGTIRAIVLELICDFVARGIMWLLSALASAAFTFGASVPAAVSGVVLDAVSTMMSVANKIKKAFDKVADLLQSLGKIHKGFATLGEKVRGLGDSLVQKMGEGLTSASRSAVTTHIDNVTKFSDYTWANRTSSSIGGHHAANNAHGWAADQWRNGLGWGGDGAGTVASTTRGAADLASGLTATGVRGGLGSTKGAVDSTDPDDREEEE